jgi:HSP20 family protein
MDSLVRWKPTFELMPRRFWDWGMEDIFQDVMETRGWEKERWTPKVEAYRKNGKYVIKAELPGVEAKNIHVSVENNYLTIRGERKMDKETKKKNLGAREIFYGAFQHSLLIPGGLKLEEIRAKYHDGVLEITAPVDEKFLPKKIEVEHRKE